MKRLNLRPSRPRRPASSLIAWGILVGVVAVAGFATVSALVTHDRLAAQRRTLQQEAETLESEAAQIRPKLALVTQVQQALQTMRASEAPRDLSARLEEAIPSGVWLTALSLGATQVRVGGSSLRWQSIDTFVKSLRASGLTVQLESVSREAGRVDAFRFSLVILAPSTGVRP